MSTAAVFVPVTSVRHPLARALLALTFTTGLIDAVSYLGLGHVFTANMTGNVVLLGFGIAGSGGLPIVAPFVSLGAFLVGAAAGGVLVTRLGERRGALIGLALTTEVTGIASATVIAAAVAVRPNHGAAYAMIALMAGALGLRNATVRSLGVPDLSTTVLTMTLTGLAADARPAGTGKGSVRRGSAVAAMLSGALVGALLLKTELWLPLALAATLACTTGAAYLPTTTGGPAKPSNSTR